MQFQYLHDNTYFDLFEQQAKIHLHNTAVVCENNSMTYEMLLEQVGRMAGLFREKGVGRHAVVAVLADRSISMLIAILAIHRVGGCYLPVDKNTPTEQINFLLQNSDAAFLLTDDLERTLRIDFSVDKISNISAYQSYAEDRDTERPGVSSDLAYIVYTSGTTGVPKGVMIEHTGMLNHLKTKLDLLGLDSDTAIAQTASHCFDISIWQFLAPLLTGGKVVIIKNELINNPNRLIQEINQQDVTVIELVPSYLTVFLKQAGKLQNPFPKLRHLLTTGEVVSPQLIHEWFRHFPGIPVINAYGPTEASDDIAHYWMDEPSVYDRIPVGKPIPNCNIYILNEHGKLCLDNETGEICVSGICVGRGYINNPARTKEQFTEDPFRPDVKMYRTGDIGYWLDDGNLMYVGRKDNQVKIRGYRIELGEIEHCIATFPDIAGVTAIVHGAEDNRQICACIVSNQPVEMESLWKHCRLHLSVYKIPNHIFLLEKFPMTVNGKVDKTELLSFITKSIEQTADTVSAQKINGNSTSEKVKDIIVEIFGLQNSTQLNGKTSFIDLNVDSMTFIKLIIAVEDAFNIELQEYSLDIKNFPDIDSFIQYVEDTLLVSAKL